MNRAFFISILIFLISISVKSQNTLFKKYKRNPLFDVGLSKPDWRSKHVANTAVFTPQETKSGTWRIYVRGNGYAPDYGCQIGILYQDTSGFSPYGPWYEYVDNPVLEYGSAGSYDEQHLLAPAPVIGEDGVIYLYYQAYDINGVSSLSGARSEDGGFNFQKLESNPLKLHVGANDAIYHNGKYYIYYGDALYNEYTHKFDSKLEIHLKVTTDPEYVRDKDSAVALGVGGGPDNFDSESVNGSRIFRLEDKWYMIYQGSNRHFDFPDRFHAAYSEDLVNWTKVDNDFPLLTRGQWGKWDQGGIWYGEVFQFKDTLYMLYEGWGCYCIPEDRDEPYFPGNSRTGIAKVSVADFKLWAEGGFDSTWVNDYYGPEGTIIDFEEYFYEFKSGDSDIHYTNEPNPSIDAINNSLRSGKIIIPANESGVLESAPFIPGFDFSYGSKFSLKIFSELIGSVTFSLEHPDSWILGQIEIKKDITKVNEWVDLEFDFGSYRPKSDLYGRIVLKFDPEDNLSPSTWFFDDLRFESIITDVYKINDETKYENDLKIIYDINNNNISLKGVKKTDPYKIISVTGKLLREGRGNYVDLNSLKPGVYLIVVNDRSKLILRQ